MGPRLGKLCLCRPFYYSYDMSAPDKKAGKQGSPQDGEEFEEDGKGSGGERDIGCASFQRSDQWGKSKRRLKGVGVGSSGKKEFFGKRNGIKKWGISKKGGKGEEAVEPPNSSSSLSCVCTMYRRTSEGEAGVVGNSTGSSPSNTGATTETIQRILGNSKQVGSGSSSSSANPLGHLVHAPIIDLSRFNPADYPIDDEDERMRQQRAKEMEEGVPVELSSLMGAISVREDYPTHSQADFVHYLVPDLKEITNCSFYWGKIDRYEAEKLLEGKPEGTFLLRDSAQEEYLFSVSFRRYNRSLHARIEQWNNQFSFDSHDPSVFSSPTVTGLIEHYKDPSCCMFFEPMLTTRLHRDFTFGLQHLARATICSRLKYDSVNSLALPKSLKMYLKEYHYKQRVRLRRLE